MTLPTIRPIKTDQEREQLFKAAASDNHSVVDANYIVRLGNEIVGYFSLANSVFCNIWLHTDKVKAEHTMHLHAAMEDILAAKGAAGYIMPCVKGSPLEDYMERFGFKKIADVGLYVKSLAVGQPQTADELSAHTRNLQAQNIERIAAESRRKTEMAEVARQAAEEAAKKLQPSTP